MPQVRSQSAKQQRRRHRQHSTTRPKSRQPTRPPVRAATKNKQLAMLAQPSPFIGDTCTTHNQMLFWVGWFARFHTDGRTYVPYEIKTIDCPVVRSDGSPMLKGDGQPQMMRCVREIARSETDGTVRWQVITWNVGQVGATFQPCASLDVALAAFNAPVLPLLRQ